MPYRSLDVSRREDVTPLVVFSAVHTVYETEGLLPTNIHLPIPIYRSPLLLR